MTCMICMELKPEELELKEKLESEVLLIMEEKILFSISNAAGYDNRDMYMRLSKTNIDFLNWLNDNGFLGYNVEYNILEELPNVAEF